MKISYRLGEFAELHEERTILFGARAKAMEVGPLAEGEVLGHEVTCPWHGATFDIRTGEVLGPPAYEDVARYNVRVTGTDIEVEVVSLLNKAGLADGKAYATTARADQG